MISPQILDLGYAATGLMVGLAFTPTAVRRLTSLMPVALVQSILVMGGCALVGLGFARATGLSALDGYLATTPGGLPAVTAIAIDSSASVALIITMQLVRLFVALILAPVLGAVMRRSRKRSLSGRHQHDRPSNEYQWPTPQPQLSAAEGFP